MEELPVILVIEDDEGVQGIVEDALSGGGFETAIAASGEEAVTLLKGRLINYRALVTDIGLPGKIDGWEVAEQARQIDPKFPIVYMSGAHAEDWASKGVPNSIMYERRTRRRLGFQGRPQQHHVGKAFRARATCYRRFSASQCRYATDVIRAASGPACSSVSVGCQFVERS